MSHAGEISDQAGSVRMHLTSVNISDALSLRQGALIDANSELEGAGSSSPLRHVGLRLRLAAHSDRPRASRLLAEQKGREHARPTTFPQDRLFLRGRGPRRRRGAHGRSQNARGRGAAGDDLAAAPYGRTTRLASRRCEILDDLLRDEGFADVRYVPARSRTSGPRRARRRGLRPRLCRHRHHLDRRRRSHGHAGRGASGLFRAVRARIHPQRRRSEGQDRRGRARDGGRRLFHAQDHRRQRRARSRQGHQLGYLRSGRSKGPFHRRQDRRVHDVSALGAGTARPAKRAT